MTNWEDSCRQRLASHLDENGDLEPPWARFPDYERYCMGWRMGSGEDWLGLWHVFVEQLPRDEASRLAYLRRHPPAPINWADHVENVLRLSPLDDADEDEEPPDEPTPARLEELEQLGLIGSDVAFKTWLERQRSEISWPWRHSETPETAARYSTRPLWFWSRQIAQLRPTLALPELPPAWRICEQPLLTGSLASIDPNRGLQSLALLSCAGNVRPPWQFGLSLSDFRDSFDDDMPYVDAFRLWAISCMDDIAQLTQLCEQLDAPPAWKSWLLEQCGLTS
ncbi:MAG TPA: hypothetical protein VFQ61_15855 [Polyangiaceae bacterium]|nr:hypothetical protein [Polyangiaceae bacterium]